MNKKAKDSKSKKEIPRFTGVGMDEVHKRHMIKIMKTFKPEDYKEMSEFYREMMGPPPSKIERNYLRALAAAKSHRTRTLKRIWQDGLWPEAGKPNSEDSLRHGAIAEVLRSIPEEWYTKLKLLKMNGGFRWFVAPFGIDGACLPVHEGTLLYLSPRLEYFSRDIVVGVVAHELAHIVLEHRGGPEHPKYLDHEEEAYKLVSEWGFKREVRKHVAKVKRRERMYSK